MPGGMHENDDDPLTLALDAEIAHETKGEQEVRLKQEKDAKRVSEHIDQVIREEKAALTKTRPVKILLLGTYA